MKTTNDLANESYAQWYIIVAEIITGKQEELKAVMLDQISEWTGEEVTDIEDLKIGDIVGWLIDNMEEISNAGLLK
jgi:hypothetical protein